MRKFIISKKLLQENKVAGEVTVDSGYIRARTNDATLMRVLEECYKQEAWKRQENGEEVSHELIKDKVRAFIYNLTTKLPSPYYFDKISKKIENPKYDKYIKGV